MSDLKNVQPLADFNWDEFENGSKVDVSKKDLEKAYDETLNKVSEHQVVEGTVISIDKKEVIVNIGYKSDGIIPASEFRYNPEELGTHQRSSRERRSHPGLHQVPYQRRHDCRCIRHRGIPARKPD